MKDAMLAQTLELVRETFEGGLPGQGTQYLDHDSGVRNTLRRISAEQASQRPDGHPSIAAHVRHVNFLIRASAEWMQGDHGTRDWAGSFEPQTVTPDDWARLQEELERSRAELERVLQSLSAEQLVEEGAGMGVVAHLAYHLGAIRQLMHRG